MPGGQAVMPRHKKSPCPGPKNTSSCPGLSGAPPPAPPPSPIRTVAVPQPSWRAPAGHPRLRPPPGTFHSSHNDPETPPRSAETRPVSVVVRTNLTSPLKKTSSCPGLSGAPIAPPTPPASPTHPRRQPHGPPHPPPPPPPPVGRPPPPWVDRPAKGFSAWPSPQEASPTPPLVRFLPPNPQRVGLTAQGHRASMA